MIHLNNKKLTFFNLALMTISANFGIRWLAVAGGIGPSSLLFWLIGALVFLLPLAIMSAQLSVAYPEEGGVYAWTKEVLGEKHGFLIAWFYWVNNLFFYPALLIFLVSNFAYFIDRPELATNLKFVTITSLIFFWGIVFVSLAGIKASKNIISFGGVVGGIIPILLLIVFAAYLLLTGHSSATVFSINTMKPSHAIFDNISSLSILMFAMAGIEIIPTFANSVRNVKKDLYPGIIIGSIILFVLYFIGTSAMNVIASPETIQKASGVVNTFSIIDNKLGIHFMTRIVSFALAFAELASLTVWIIGPVIMFFKCTPKGILPNWLHKTNVSGTPTNAIIFQGIIVTVIILLNNLIENVNNMYQALIIMTTILYFLPYIFLAIVYIKSKALSKHNIFLRYILFSLLMVAVIFGIVISFAPSSDLKTTHQIIVYECEIFFGPLIFIIIGILIRNKRKHIWQ
ncbi:MAG: APC family permease [Burkholderiales bacterium]|jgi:amino acid transporter|nr:APC family permease [Burkholderiales bacterium]